MHTSDCLQERHFAATGPVAHAKRDANQADKYGVGQKGDKRCLCSAGRAASAAPHRRMASPGGGSSLGLQSPALQDLLCSPGGERASSTSPGAGGDMGTCRAGPGSGPPSHRHPLPCQRPRRRALGVLLQDCPTSLLLHSTTPAESQPGRRKKSGKHRLDAARGCRRWLSIEMPPRPPARPARVERPPAAISEGLLRLAGPRGAIARAATELLGGNAPLAEPSNAAFPSPFYFC